MKKRFLVLFVTFILLLTLTVPSLAGLVCGYCESNCIYQRYGRSPTYTSSESCRHHPNGTDVTYYHYDYYRWKCTGCGYTFGNKDVYVFEKMVCNGY